MDCSKCRDHFPLAQPTPNFMMCPQCADLNKPGASEAEKCIVQNALQCAGCGCYGMRNALCSPCLQKLLSEEALPFPLSAKANVVDYITRSHQTMNSATVLFTQQFHSAGMASSAPQVSEGPPILSQVLLAPPGSQAQYQPNPGLTTPGFLSNSQQAQFTQLSSLASGYQAQASEHRLTGRSQNQQLQKASKIKTSINEQRKDGKEGKLATLQIGALAYFLHNAEFKEPYLLSQVGPFNELFSYQPGATTNSSLPAGGISGLIDSFLAKVAERVAEVFPGSRPVTSENVELRVKDASKKTLWALDKFVRQQLNSLATIDSLYRLAVSRGWMTYGGHSLTIAFIVSNDEVILDMIGKISKKKKRGLDDLDLDDERGSSSSSRSSRAKRQSIVSTFRRPSVTPAASSVSAAPRTFKLQFKDIFFDSRLECQVDPGTGEVTFQSEPSFVSEVLKISEDWLKGYDLLRGIKSTSYNLHSHYEYGVLGMGYFKLGVEACYNDEPMVVLFYHGDGFASDMASEEAKAGLQNELEALKLAQDVFLPAFESLLRETGFKTMPKLHFNAEKAFLGRITIPEPVTARKIDVQHPQGYADGRTYTVMESGGWFLATALLPYGPTKPQVIKFTGTDADGESPRDASDKDKLGEEVAQAFAHFVYVYSKESRLLVDLQGVWAADGTQTITLIDPQLLKSEVRDDKVKIDRYMKSHSCRRLCQALHLHDTKAASPSPSNQDDDDDPSGDYRDEADELYDDDY